MPNPLETFLKDHIQKHGPIDVGQFMSFALSHPEYGYYMKQDPFGRGGDFTTAPEVSQMFGEMIGAWAADIWMQMGAPARFNFVECGPGRGTLMADMLRATKGVVGFHDAAQSVLVEISPALKARQQEALSDYDVQWAEALSDISDDLPMVLIANELLDALPFRQIQYVDRAWRERVIDYKDGFAWAHRRFDGEGPQDAKEGDVFEFSPAREGFVQDVAERVRVQNGAALFIDYGHIKSGSGDTFQALKDHKYVDVLSDVGNADLTSHVDFEALKRVAGSVSVHGAVTQGAFLNSLGIEVRADMLRKKSPNIGKDLHRLTDDAEMGALFKVLGLSFHDQGSLNPAGF